jgi:6-pyruvoyltetrahydropterin/6-carboxytetrahydropterin synthase
MSWKILIERSNLNFAAAHFITFAGECEPLHGHNYGVRVEVAGPLTADSYVLDFAVLKDIVRVLCQAWDHRFLMPLHNPFLRVVERGADWEIEYTGDLSKLPTSPIRYAMPAWTVVALPVDNVTAERLAERMAYAIADELQRRGVADAAMSITVGIAETNAQTAFFTLDRLDALESFAARDLPPPGAGTG